MQKTLSVLLAAAVSMGAGSVMAGPADDLKSFRNYFKQKFPGVEMEDYANGVYALNADKRSQWEAMEDFPPYEEFVEMGQEAWETEFKNGNSFASCFGSDASAVRAKYPHWDSKTEKVVTLEGDINKCLKDNGEKPYKWKKGTMAHVSAYLGYEARDQKVDVQVPNDAKALQAYEDGKRFFYGKKGQLNLSCADCHVYSSGMRVRGNILSPALGHTTHFPVYRGSWARKDKKNDGLGTLHRRYGGCNKQVRARPFKAQSDEYRNMELFHAYMSNGLPINAPGYRE